MTEPAAATDVVVRELGADESSARIAELRAIIRDAVVHGSSINFLAHATDDDIDGYWHDSIAEQAAGRRVLFVAEHDGRLVGTALLMYAPQQNQPHRAEVGKMLVLSTHRRRGLARRLLREVEARALAVGRTLLMLDTEKDSAGELLYAANGWIRFGEVPGHAMNPDGVPQPTSFFYKVLSADQA